MDIWDGDAQLFLAACRQALTWLDQRNQPRTFAHFIDALCSLTPRLHGLASADSPTGRERLTRIWLRRYGLEWRRLRTLR